MHALSPRIGATAAAFIVVSEVSLYSTLGTFLGLSHKSCSFLEIDLGTFEGSGAVRADSPAQSGLRVAGFAGASRVNGPGLRAVVWVQGCTLGCSGCFNPATHAASGEAQAPEVVAARVVAAWTPDHMGLTLSGGEPFQQAEAAAEVARRVKSAQPRSTLMVFTGYTLEELRGDQAPLGAADLLSEVNLLVDGRFESGGGGYSRPLRASANQRLWVLRGRSPLSSALPPDGASELAINDAGDVLLSGFPAPGLLAAVRQLAR
jgi:anaerobic ribonucleoside-triphosphate reductase activating protein